MPIEGFFQRRVGEAAAPYVPGYIDFPGLGITERIDFPIDTGSYATCLHPRDIERLGIDYQRLDPSSLTGSAGIGGIRGYYLEPAYLMFQERDGTPRFCELDVLICESSATQQVLGFPSLLGRDFLNLCSLLLDSSQNLVHLEPLNLSGPFIQPVASG